MERLNRIPRNFSWLALSCIALILLPMLAQAADIQFQREGAYVDGVRCGTYTPSFEETEQNAARIDAWRMANGGIAPRRADVVIPIAFHVVAQDDGYGDVPDAQIYDQMDVLNAAYAGTGFSFTLASIDRTYNTQVVHASLRQPSNERKMKEALAIDPATTFNIYLCNIGGGLLGYATFPDMYPEDSYMHGVVALLRDSARRRRGSLQRGRHDHPRGRPLPGPVPHLPGRLHRAQRLLRRHAAGRVAGLRLPRGSRHLHGDPGLDPIHNFMDYVDDYCMYEFTADQADPHANEQMGLFRPTMYGGVDSDRPDRCLQRLAHQRRLPADGASSPTSPPAGPTSWSWTFGDGGTANAQNPSHTYTAAGTYTVSLTVSNLDGSDTLTRTGYITVTEPGSGGSTMYVSAMTVGRKSAGPNDNGTCTVSVVDDGGAAVDGATVTVSYDGPNSGTLSGTTAGGSVSFSTPKLKNAVGEWCFEVTGVTHASLTYDSAANVTTRSCEAGDVYRGAGPKLMLTNEPNPFNPRTQFQFVLENSGYTTLRVYDTRGRLVATPLERNLGPGWHEVTWDGGNQPSGVYFYQLMTGEVVLTRKLTILK